MEGKCTIITAFVHRTISNVYRPILLYYIINDISMLLSSQCDIQNQDQSKMEVFETPDTVTKRDDNAGTAVLYCYYVHDVQGITNTNIDTSHVSARTSFQQFEQIDSKLNRTIYCLLC